MITSEYDEELCGVNDLCGPMPELDDFSESWVKEIMRSSPSLLDKIVESCTTGVDMDQIDLDSTEPLLESLRDFEENWEGLDISRLTFSHFDDLQMLDVSADVGESKSPEQLQPVQKCEKRASPIKLKISRNSQGTMQCKLYSKESLKNNSSADINGHVEISKNNLTDANRKIMKNNVKNKMNDVLKSEMEKRPEESKENKNCALIVKKTNLIQEEKKSEEISARIKAKLKNEKKSTITVIPAMPKDPLKKNKSQRTKKINTENKKLLNSISSDHDYCINLKTNLTSSKSENKFKSNNVATTDNDKSVSRKNCEESRKKIKSTNNINANCNDNLHLKTSATLPSQFLKEKSTNHLTEHNKKSLTKTGPSNSNMVSVLKKSQNSLSSTPSTNNLIPVRIPINIENNTKSVETNSKNSTILANESKEIMPKQSENLHNEVPNNNEIDNNQAKINSDIIAKPVENSKNKSLSLQSYYDRKSLNRDKVKKATKLYDIYYLSTNTDDPNFCEVGFHSHALPIEVINKIKAPKEKRDCGCQTDVSLKSYFERSIKKSASYYYSEKELMKISENLPENILNFEESSPNAYDSKSINVNTDNLNIDQKQTTSISCTQTKPEISSNKTEQKQLVPSAKNVNNDATDEQIKNKVMSSNIMQNPESKKLSNKVRNQNSNQMSKEKLVSTESKDNLHRNNNTNENENDDNNESRRKRRRCSSCTSKSSCSIYESDDGSTSNSSSIEEISASSSSDRRSRSRIRRKSNYKRKHGIDNINHEYYSRNCDSRSSSYSNTSSVRSMSSPKYKKSSVYSSSDSRSSSYSPYEYLDQSKSGYNSCKFRTFDNSRNRYADRSTYDDRRIRRYYYRRSPDSYYNGRTPNRKYDEEKRAIEERRVVYVGRLDKNVTKEFLHRKFKKFGTIIDITIRFRSNKDNYGFITFKNRQDAYAAIEHGNDDLSYPKYDLSFGGRREFCKVQYADLDDKKDFKEENRIRNLQDVDFNILLKSYAESQKRKKL